jgi:hypothetical protein
MPSLRNASGEGDDPAAVRLWPSRRFEKGLKSAPWQLEKKQKNATADPRLGEHDERWARHSRGVKQFSADIIWATVSHSS